MAAYSPSDISSLLNVKESTLRKYSLLLEEYGYKFQRNAQEQRWYNDKDVSVLKRFMTLKQNGAMSLKECAEGVYLWSRGGDVTDGDTTIVTLHNGEERHNNDMTPMIQQEMLSMRELIEDQREVIQKLYEQLERQNSYQEARDRVLLSTIEELKTDFQQQRDEQKAIEEQKALQAPEEKTTTIWSRLFKK